MQIKPEFVNTHDESTLTLTLEEGAAAPTSPMSLDVWNGLLHGRKESLAWDVPVAAAEGEWTLTAVRNATERLDPDALDDIFVVCSYTVS